MADTKDKSDFSKNPFVGPHPIETGRNIFGRNREIDDLYYLLSAERIVMLHSPSGAGKTSLIQAGLIPRLNERFDVWGPTRVNQLPAVNSPTTTNRYIRSAVLGFKQQVPAERRRTEDQLGTMTLADYVTSRREESKNIVLIFDQFEEILTADPLAIDAKRDFFKQLGELLLDPRIWTLFAMREDYLPALDPYAEQVPTHLKNWFRLDLLRRDKATEAITETAKEGGRQFDADAVTELVTDLATMKVQQPDGTFAPQKGLYVEPLQLQVVCRRLWERMPADKQTIDLAEIEQSGDVTTALADYYATEVARLANGDVRIERKLREWVGERLITSDGIRSQVLRGAGQSEGLDNELIASLVNTHLVRGEQREGATWYELAHDRLIEPVRKNNQKWFDDHLHKVQKLASLWEREGRPDGLLLLGANLVEANKWAEQSEVSLADTESRFLNASATKQEAIEKEARQAKRLRQLLAIMVLLFLLAGVAASVASSYYRNADKQRKRAEASEVDSRGLLYVANQLLAWNAYDQKDFLRTNDFLEASLPMPEVEKKEDARGFDWFYLWRQTQNKMENKEKLVFEHDSEGAVTGSFSLDGKMLASGTASGVIILWDLKSGKQLRKLEGHTGRVNSVAFSPDGMMLASGSDDKTVKLWDVRSGKELRKLEWHTESVKSVSFSPDGHTLASGSVDKTVRLSDVNGREELHKLDGHADVVASVSFSPDGHMLASGSDDKTVRLWDVRSGKELRRLEWHTGPVNSVSFSPDGRTLSSGSGDHSVKLWDVRSGQKLRTVRIFFAKSVSFSPDGRTLAVGSSLGSVMLLDSIYGKELRKLSGQFGAVTSVSFSPDGLTLASGTTRGVMTLWDLKSGKELHKLEGHTAPVYSVSFSPDGYTLASGSDDNMVRLWDVRSGKELHKLEGHTAPVYSVSFSPDGHLLASGSEDMTVRLWNVVNGKEMHKLNGHNGYVRSVSFSPNGRMLVSGSADQTVRLWDVESGTELRKLEGAVGLGQVCSVSFSPDGKMLAAGSGDNSVRLWDVGSGKELRKIQSLGGTVYSVSFSPDGRMMAFGDEDGTVHLLNLDGKVGYELEGHAAWVYSVSFSPDGHTLASGSDDKTVRLWDVRSGKELRKLEGHLNDVYSVSFSPDSRMLASSSGGEIEKNGKRIPFGEILIWRGATDEEVTRQCVRCGRKD